MGIPTGSLSLTDFRERRIDFFCRLSLCLNRRLRECCVRLLQGIRRALPTSDNGILPPKTTAAPQQKPLPITTTINTQTKLWNTCH
jgi:hypothetical protein